MYQDPFYLTQKKGNNDFAWAERGVNPQLYVPARKQGSFEDVRLGDQIVFADLDENGELQKCTGLESFVENLWKTIPTVIVDNHNHVFYFWYEALEKGWVQPGATLIHVDQHKDMRPAPEPYVHTGLDSAFHYTNEVLNVGNYIKPAMQEGLIGEVQLVTGEMALDDLSYLGKTNKILNIDLDYFVDELEIDFEKAKRFIEQHLEEASLVTIATSPFFIDQGKAIEILRVLTEES